MKKIGILTYHRAINYGALLQAYALREKISEFGADVSVIDYRCPFIETAYSLTHGMEKKDFRSRMTVLRGIPTVHRKTKHFRKFAAKHLGLTKYCKHSSFEKTCGSFDAVIAGSDQVWNMKLCGEDHTYLLDFHSGFHKYSYAVSLGDYTLTQEEAVMLSEFEAISLREKRTAEYVKQAVGRETRTDIDPTLLLERKQWEKLVLPEYRHRKPYIFIYSVHPQNRMVVYAKKMAKEKGYDIIHLHNRVKKDICEEGVQLVFDCSPEEFLTLIHDAACVVTNSFHGTVFSILFQKQFLSELETKAGFNNRVWELLQSLGIPRRILDEVPGINDGVTMDEPIDWDLVERRRQEQAKGSEQYLSDIAAGR